MNHREAARNDAIRAWVGTLMMVAASTLAVLIFVDRMEMNFLSMPVVWYSSRPLHLIMCGAMFIAASILLRAVPAKIPRDGRPMFRSVRLLTRNECHLCEDALAVLLSFQEVLPSIEIVEIDDNPQLVRQFGESVPVVEIDGRVRFRGAVSPALLQRLVDAAELREEHQVAQSDDLKAPSSGIIIGRKD